MSESATVLEPGLSRRMLRVAAAHCGGLGELAKELGVSVSAIGAWQRNGLRPHRADQVRKILARPIAADPLAQVVFAKIARGTDDVAAALGVTDATLHRWIRIGRVTKRRHAVAVERLVSAIQAWGSAR